MKNVKIIAMAILLGCSAAFAQNSFRVTAGGALPLGNFGKANVTTDNINQWALMYDDHSSKGGAGMGITVGLQDKIGIPNVDGLGVTISVDGFLNFLNSKLNDFYEKLEDESGNTYNDIKVDYCSVTKQKYLNIAPMLGLNYQYNVSDAFGLYAGFGIGANIRKITDMEYDAKMTASNGEYLIASDNFEYDIAASFAYKIEIGTVIAEHVVIGLNYFGLGTQKVRGTAFATQNDSGHTTSNIEKLRGGKVNPMLFTFCIGVQF